MQSSYTHFAALAHQALQCRHGPVLSPQEECLLNFVAVRTQGGRSLSVTELMREYPVGADHTVFIRIQALRHKRFLRVVQFEEDKRVKHLVLSKQALEYFDTLGKCIEEMYQDQPTSSYA